MARLNVSAVALLMFAALALSSIQPVKAQIDGSTLTIEFDNQKKTVSLIAGCGWRLGVIAATTDNRVNATPPCSPCVCVAAFCNCSKQVLGAAKRQAVIDALAKNVFLVPSKQVCGGA